MTYNQKLVEALEEGNKWWKSKFEIDFKPREVYEYIKKFLKTRQIIALTGLRRAGKTTIMLKMVQERIKNSDAKSTLYFSFDDFREIRIRDVINTYARIMNKDLNKGNYLFLFDEIQKVDNWEEQIKRIYDNFRNIKLIVSGSESLFIRKKSRESLAGRFFEFKVNPLNFREYLLFKGRKIDNLELYKEDVLREFNSYLLCNGFPEIVNEDKKVIRKYIKENLIEKIVYADMPKIVAIKEPSIIEELFKIILYNPGQIINIENLAGELGISRQTASIYLDYLEKSFLIRKLYNFSRSARKTQRKLKKYYPTIIAPEMAENAELFGKVFESVMILQLDAELFWRDTYKNEVDAIKIINNEIVPIEIKTSKIDTKPLSVFMNKFKVNIGLILTYDKKDIIKLNGKEINVVPFYEYLR